MTLPLALQLVVVLHRVKVLDAVPSGRDGDSAADDADARPAPASRQHVRHFLPLGVSRSQRQEPDVLQPGAAGVTPDDDDAVLAVKVNKGAAVLGSDGVQLREVDPTTIRDVETLDQVEAAVAAGDDDGPVAEADGAVRVPRRRHLGSLEPLSGFDAVHLNAVGVAGKFSQTSAEHEQEVALLQKVRTPQLANQNIPITRTQSY